MRREIQDHGDGLSARVRADRTELRRLDGIRQLVPNYVERTLRVEYDPARVDAARVLDTLSRIGFPARDLARPSDVVGTDPLRDRRRWTLVAVGGEVTGKPPKSISQLFCSKTAFLPM